MARRDSASRIEDLAREFDQTRQRLDGTLQELAERTKPGNAARRGLRRWREAGRSLLEEAKADGARDDARPVPPELVLLGIGVGAAAAAVGVAIWLRRRGR